MPLRVVRRWRVCVPSDFVFSVRCHRDLTHRFGLRACEESFRVFSVMVDVRRALKAPILHLQTPPSTKLDGDACRETRDFFNSVLPKDIRVALEVRGGFDASVIDLMRDLDIIHCVDISKVDPPLKTDVLYPRLFGRGYHTLYEFDDEELVEIECKVKEGGYKEAYLVFHGLRMYEDAYRLKLHFEKGCFPQPN